MHRGFMNLLFFKQKERIPGERVDLVVIRKQTEAQEGDIVVALEENGANTLKRYGGIDEESHSAILLYQNQKEYPDRRILVNSLIVQGVAKHVIKAI